MSRTAELETGAVISATPHSVTGWPGVRGPSLGELVGGICDFCLSVAARVVVCPSPKYTDQVVGTLPKTTTTTTTTNKQTKKGVSGTGGGGGGGGGRGG